MILHVARAAKRLYADENGNSLALFAMALPMVIGAVGLAVDTAHWIVLKRQLQAVADSAAMSGSLTAIKGGDIDYAVDDDASRNRGKIENMQTRATLSPENRPGDPYAVAVKISAPAGLSFASLFMSKPLIVSASATATMIETQDFCAFALDGSDEPGISIDPNSKVESDCGIATNSSAPDAVRGDASSQFAARKLFAVGGIVGTGTGSGGRVKPYSLAQSDPGADVKLPDIPNTGCPNMTVNPGSNEVQLQPGCFGNLALNGKVRLNPGNYVLNRGNVVFGPKAEVTCDGCTIFLTSQDADASPTSIGRATLDPAANVQMSAPSDGPYSGLLMVQDRRAAPEVKGEENIIAGNANSKLDGILYFPSQTLRLDGSASPDMKCARLIGRKLILQGHILITQGCTADKGKLKLSGAEVKLVS